MSTFCTSRHCTLRTSRRDDTRTRLQAGGYTSPQSSAAWPLFMPQTTVHAVLAKLQPCVKMLGAVHAYRAYFGRAINPNSTKLRRIA